MEEGDRFHEVGWDSCLQGSRRRGSGRGVIWGGNLDTDPPRPPRSLSMLHSKTR